MEKRPKVQVRAKDYESLLTASDLGKGYKLRVDEAGSKVSLYLGGQKVCVWRDCNWKRVSKELSEMRSRGDL